MTDEERIVSPGGSMSVEWRISRSRADHYDHDTDYEITVRSTATGKTLFTHYWSHEYGVRSGVSHGFALTGVTFSQDARTIILHGGKEAIEIALALPKDELYFEVQYSGWKPAK